MASIHNQPRYLIVIGIDQDVDNVVCQEMLRQKYTGVDCTFVQLFPTQPLFEVLDANGISLHDYDRRFFVNVWPSQGDIPRLNAYGGADIYTGGSDLRLTTYQSPNVRLQNFETCPAAEIINNHGQNGTCVVPMFDPRNNAVLTMLRQTRDVGEFDGWGAFNAFLVCTLFREELFSSGNGSFQRTMQIGCSEFYEKECKSRMSVVNEARQSAQQRICENHHYRTFNGHDICVVDDEKVDMMWAYHVARVSTRQPKIGAVIVRNVPNGGIGVVFHNFTDPSDGIRQNDSTGDSLHVARTLGLQGNARFTYLWFHNQEELDAKFSRSAK